MKSVLGKLIQREFGRDAYASYREKMNQKQSMDIFCDIYERLRHESSDDLNHALKNLLESVQISIRISRNFLYIVMGFAITFLTLLLLELPIALEQRPLPSQEILQTLVLLKFQWVLH